MTTPQPRFIPGEDVHPIQARLAFEDVAGIRLVRLDAVEPDVVVIELDGRLRRFASRRATELLDLLDRAIPVGRGGWIAFFHEGKHLLAVPVGEPGVAIPAQLGIAGGVVRLRDGAAVEAVTTETGWSAVLLSLAETDGRPALA